METRLSAFSTGYLSELWNVRNFTALFARNNKWGRKYPLVFASRVWYNLFVNANQQLKFEKDGKISTNGNLMSCNNEPSARREGVLRGSGAPRSESQ